MTSKSTRDHLVDLTMSLAVSFKAEPATASELLIEAIDMSPSPSRSVDLRADESSGFKTSAREEIRRRVEGFRAHQQSVARKREAHYLQERERMRSLLALAGGATPTRREVS